MSRNKKQYQKANPPAKQVASTSIPVCPAGLRHLDVLTGAINKSLTDSYFASVFNDTTNDAEDAADLLVESLVPDHKFDVEFIDAVLAFLTFYPAAVVASLLADADLAYHRHPGREHSLLACLGKKLMAYQRGQLRSYMKAVGGSRG